MKALLKKEFELCMHPTVLFFPFLVFLMLIPDYPYHVAFIYNCVTVFYIFITARENGDFHFTASLPVTRADMVKARCAAAAAVELAQILAAIPVAVLNGVIYHGYSVNRAGTEANMALFGSVLIMYSVFNIIFIPGCYKSLRRIGFYMAAAGSAGLVYIAASEAAISLIPALKRCLDTTDPAHIPEQAAVLAAGVIIYAASMAACVHFGARNFEKVDL